MPNMMNISPLRLLLALSALLVSAPGAWAEPDIYAVYANGGTQVINGREGLSNLADQYKQNPQSMTVYVYKHPIYLKVLSGRGAHVTRLRFSCPELGISQTFHGANTDEIVSRWQDYVQRANFNSRLVSLVMYGRG